MDTGLITASDKLMYEMRQSTDEGKDISRYEGMMKEILALAPGAEKETRSLRCLDWMATLLPREDYPYREPSDWEGIRAAMGSMPDIQRAGPDMNRILGAWQGRAAGCLLGKPFECVGSREIRAYFDDRGGDQLPDFEYFRMTDREACKPFAFRDFLSIERLDGMPSDDDTNYTVLGDELVRRFGRAFTTLDVASLWMSAIPAHRVCTAERVAYRNLLNRHDPPRSATIRNPYREWIGAQIRADYFGYINPGDPLTAAHMAHTEACMTHTRNGIYGAMWVAATLACAFVTGDAAKAARMGMAYIPQKSRLHTALTKAFDRHLAGFTWRQAMEALRNEWHEQDFFDWSHTISNAVIVLNCLLYGERDFGKTVGMAMLYGFDTDCNGATAGSIFGAAYGSGAIDEKWTRPIRDTLYTDIPGHCRVSLTEMASRTAEMIERGERHV